MDSSLIFNIIIVTLLFIISAVFYTQLNKIHIFQEQKLGSIKQEIEDKLAQQKKHLEEQFDSFARGLKQQEHNNQQLENKISGALEVLSNNFDIKHQSFINQSDGKINKFVDDITNDISNQLQINAQVIELLQKQYKEFDALNIKLKEDLFEKTEAILTEIKSPLKLY